MWSETTGLFVRWLFLLMVANGIPIIMKRIFTEKGAWPVDAGWQKDLAVEWYLRVRDFLYRNAVN